jgi:hypothetical protein
MTLNHATLKADTVEINFNIGQSNVHIIMPYANFAHLQPGTLHDQAEAYINQMSDLATLLS